MSIIPAHHQASIRELVKREVDRITKEIDAMITEAGPEVLGDFTHPGDDNFNEYDRLYRDEMVEKLLLNLLS